MKILHILDASLPVVGGYTVRAKYIIELQESRGISPIVVTSPNYARTPAYEEIKEIPYYRSYAPPSGLDHLILAIPFAREQRKMARLQRKIAEVARNLKVDLLHAHSPSLCGLPALKVAQGMKLPFVYEVRALWEDAAVDRRRFGEGSLKYRISRNLEQRLFMKADAVVCICEGLKHEIVARTNKNNVYVIQNGVDTSIFTPREKAQHLIDKYGVQDKIVVGFIGSFFTFEGLADLVRSVPKIEARQKDVSFLIVGGGVEEEKVKQLARDLGVLNKTIIFTGRVPHEQIQDYYSIVDILVYPRISKRITELVTPLKPLEAMAMEKAVVASDVGGLKELVRDGETGFLFKAGNVQDLAEKILALANNEATRTEIGKNARSQMVTNREWSTIISKYRDIYGQILEGKAWQLSR